MSLVIKGGIAFLDSFFDQKDILIEDGRITGIGSSLDGDETIDAKGKLVLPGLIDPHVHLREPGDTYKEDFVTGSKAAIAGGFTTVIDMPNNAVPTTTMKRLEEKKRLAKKKAYCDVFFHFGGTDDNFDEVKKADPVSLKLYLGKTTGELLLKDPKSVERHFDNFPKEKPIVIHACGESPDPGTNLEQTHDRAEAALSLAGTMGRRVHLAHASTEKEVLLAQRCRSCSVEVTPHHLFLSSDLREKMGNFANVSPPLRSEEKRIYLWNVLEMVNCIATDHAPHTVEDKEDGAAGFPGLETSLALMLNACDNGLLDKIWVVQRMSINVAKYFNLKGKGSLRKGFAGDITIVDHKKEWKIEGAKMQTKCKWTPFEGKKVKGRVHTVVRGGKPVYEEYAFL
jgi:dihydroorotase